MNIQKLVSFFGITTQFHVNLNNSDSLINAFHPNLLIYIIKCIDKKH